MIAYLDNSATTRPLDSVVDAMAASMREGYFNPSSMYAPALRAEKAMNACRQAISSAIRGSAGTVIFTSGGTEANNLALLGAAQAMREAGEVFVSAVEHPSVLACAEALEVAGWTVVRFPVDGEGQPRWDFLEERLHEKTSLVSCMQVNNETGAMPDLARLRELVSRRAPGALVHVDGVQGFLRTPFDAGLADLYTLSGHKIHGPKGIGALWVRKGLRLAPRALGGGQEGGLRSGTENTPGIAGLLAAIQGMPEHPDTALREKKELLVATLAEAIPDLRVNGPRPAEGAPHIVNIAFPGVRGEVLLHALEAENVFVSTGSACSSKKRRISPVLMAMGIRGEVAEGALRFSLSPRTTREEILFAADVIARLVPTLRRYRRK